MNRTGRHNGDKSVTALDSAHTRQEKKKGNKGKNGREPKKKGENKGKEKRGNCNCCCGLI